MTYELPGFPCIFAQPLLTPRPLDDCVSSAGPRWAAACCTLVANVVALAHMALSTLWRKVIQLKRPLRMRRFALRQPAAAYLWGGRMFWVSNKSARMRNKWFVQAIVNHKSILHTHTHVHMCTYISVYVCAQLKIENLFRNLRRTMPPFAVACVCVCKRVLSVDYGDQWFRKKQQISKLHLYFIATLTSNCFCCWRK